MPQLDEWELKLLQQRVKTREVSTVHAREGHARRGFFVEQLCVAVVKMVFPQHLWAYLYGAGWPGSPGWSAHPREENGIEVARTRVKNLCNEYLIGQ